MTAIISENGNIELTIAIPTYNRQCYLAELLPAMVSQCRSANDGGHRVEIVVVDNASTDETSAYMLGNTSKEIRYFRNEHNVGGDANFIRCVRASLGRYVWLFGDDEILNKDAITTVLRLIKDKPALIIGRSHMQESKLFSSYAEAIKYVLPFDPIFPIHHTLITSNIFSRQEFDIQIAEENLSTNYGHMYAMTKIFSKGRIYVLGETDKLFRERDIRAEFFWTPHNLEDKLIQLCAHISDITGIRKLKTNVWFFYHAPRLYKLMHSKKIHRFLRFLSGKPRYQ